MSLAYQDETAPPPLQDGDTTLEKRRARIFETYVQRMFVRRGGRSESYAEQDTLRWLAGLARDMLDHNQQVLLVEALQPSLLRTAFELGAYILLSRLALGLILGAVEACFCTASPS
jgi:hypothetical protein